MRRDHEFPIKQDSYSLSHELKNTEKLQKSLNVAVKMGLHQQTKAYFHILPKSTLFKVQSVGI